MLKSLKNRINDMSTKLYAAGVCALKNERGQGMVEYGLIIALIAVVVLAALKQMGININSIFTKASSGLQ